MERVYGVFAKFAITLPAREDWAALKASVMEHGLYNQNLQGVPPTGSIGYINNSTASIHAITVNIEIRKEGKIGARLLPGPRTSPRTTSSTTGTRTRLATRRSPTSMLPRPSMSDQGLSLTLFFKDTATTRDVNKAPHPPARPRRHQRRRLGFLRSVTPK